MGSKLLRLIHQHADRSSHYVEPGTTAASASYCSSKGKGGKKGKGKRRPSSSRKPIPATVLTAMKRLKDTNKLSDTEIKYALCLFFRKQMKPNQQTKVLLNSLRDAFSERFKEQHMYVKPINLEVVLDHFCKEVDKEAIEKWYDTKSNLPGNVCLGPQCPSF